MEGETDGERPEQHPAKRRFDAETARRRIRRRAEAMAQDDGHATESQEQHEQCPGGPELRRPNVGQPVRGLHVDAHDRDHLAVLIVYHGGKSRDKRPVLVGGWTRDMWLACVEKVEIPRGRLQIDGSRRRRERMILRNALRAKHDASIAKGHGVEALDAGMHGIPAQQFPRHLKPRPLRILRSEGQPLQEVRVDAGGHVDGLP